MAQNQWGFVRPCTAAERRCEVNRNVMVVVDLTFSITGAMLEEPPSCRGFLPEFQIFTSWRWASVDFLYTGSTLHCTGFRLKIFALHCTAVYTARAHIYSNNSEVPVLAVVARRYWTLRQSTHFHHSVLSISCSNPTSQRILSKKFSVLHYCKTRLKL